MDKLKFVAWVDATKELFNEVNETPFTNPELQAIFNKVIEDPSVQEIWENRSEGAGDFVVMGYLTSIAKRNSTGELTVDMSKRQDEALTRELSVLHAKFSVLGLLEDVMVTLERHGHLLPPELRSSMSMIAVGAMFQASANLREKAGRKARKKPDTIH